MSDHFLPFVFDGADVRGALVSLDATWREVLARRDYPPPVRALLGEAMAAGALLAGSLRFDGTLILQTQATDAAAPVRLMVVECAPGLELRATAKLGAALPEGEAPSLAELTGDARMVVTLDPRDGRDAYQGVVPLEGHALDGAVEHYMRASEQIETCIVLAADSTRAAGLLVQKMPGEGGIGEARSVWDEARVLAATLASAELLTLDPLTILKRLFHEHDLRVFAERSLRFRCNCSRERVADMLRMLGAAEVDSVVAEQGRVAVDCEFCHRSYAFDPIDAAQLFVPPSGTASRARH